jgi:hypothetical protein
MSFTEQSGEEPSLTLFDFRPLIVINLLNTSVDKHKKDKTIQYD